MFRWYHGAAKCYVYLSDVSTSADDPRVCQSAWEADFRGSNWYTRGWTLQELIAPSSVIFYSSRWAELGDKKSLARVIHEITRIPQSAIEGHPLNTFSVDERMSWAASRQTTKDEDIAYCLLGIFGIFMPLIYGEGKEHALKRLQRELNGLPTNARTCFNVPFERNPRFTGRETLLANLESKLFVGEQTTKAAIVGLGGIGKTQIALELAYRTQDKYKNCSVLWIPVTDMDSLHEAYRNIACQLAIRGWDEQNADIKQLVKNHLSQEGNRPWLCIFDNADDMASVHFKDYLSKSKQGCVVFTTRDKKVAVKLVSRNIIEVPELDDDGAVQLLQKSIIDESLLDDQQDARSLIEELAHLPLAIVQAAAYINSNTITLEGYLSLLAEQEADVIELLSEDFEDEWRYKSIRNPVATTWLISFEQIRRRDSLAADCLAFMACIDRKDIPKSLLPAGPSRKKKINALGTLKAYSFIVQRDDAFDLHRLVHLVTRSWLQREGLLRQWSQAAIERIEEVFPDHEHHNRTQWRSLMPHAAYAIRMGIATQGNDRSLSLMRKYARTLYSDGRFREAENPFLELLDARKKMSGEVEQDEETLTCLAWLAATYCDQGRWKEAESLELLVMDTRARVLGEEHPDTLTAMNNLAMTYVIQGRLREAESLMVRTTTLRIKVLREEHPHTLTSINNLASIYWHQGRWKEAESLGLRVTEIRTKVLGEEHPDTLTSMANLASTYESQGRWEEAEHLGLRTMETRVRVLGETHPNALTSMANLASTYWHQGRLKEAEDLELRVVEINRKVFGEEHPRTLTSMDNLAATYRNQGRLEEARSLELLVQKTRDEHRIKS